MAIYNHAGAFRQGIIRRGIQLLFDLGSMARPNDRLARGRNEDEDVGTQVTVYFDRSSGAVLAIEDQADR